MFGIRVTCTGYGISRTWTSDLSSIRRISNGRTSTSAIVKTLKGCVSYLDRKSTRLNSSHVKISYAVFCLKKKIIFQGDKSFRESQIYDRLWSKSSHTYYQITRIYKQIHHMLAVTFLIIFI